MAKKKSWFNIVKRFIIREKLKTRNGKVICLFVQFWSLILFLTARTIIRIFGGLKIKTLALLTSPSSLNERTLGEAGEEQISMLLLWPIPPLLLLKQLLRLL